MGQVIHHFRELPMDILFEILGHLGPEDILQARKVSYSFFSGGELTSFNSGVSTTLSSILPAKRVG